MSELELYGQIGAPAERIVSLAPSLTEILFYLGMGDAVVGVTQHCDYPPPAAGVAKIGSFLQADPEGILALKATTVIGLGDLHRGLTTLLRDKPVGLILANYHSVAGVLDVMDGLASLADDPEAALERVAGLRRRAEALRAGRDGHHTRAVFVMTNQPVVIPGRRSYQYDALAAAGATQLPYNLTAYERVTPEQVAHFDPEVIFACGQRPGDPPRQLCPGCHADVPICRRDIGALATAPFWRETAAARSGQVYPMPCHWLCRPGPRLIDGMETIAGILAGEPAKRI